MTLSRHRFDEHRVLSEDDLRRLAPSVFAVSAHASRSERFRPIPTIEPLRRLREQGFEVVHAKQSVTHVPGKSDFTKHLLRLRRVDNPGMFAVGGTSFEVALKNANDGTSAYELFGGLYRAECMNGLMTKLADFDSLKVRHSGKPETVVENVIEGTFRVLDQAEAALVAPQDWSQLQLSRRDQQAFAEAAHELRFDENAQTIHPNRVLEVRRPEDQPNTLWHTYNRVQEHAMRGGQSYTRHNDEGRTRRMETRPVTSVDGDIKLNRALWVLADYFSKNVRSQAA